ncbi:MAG: sugar phosphate nucleotidyltransferase [Polyangiales bacterium]
MSVQFARRIRVRAMIFAAGFGTRLRPLTDVVPKPLVPVGLRPLMAFAVDHLAAAGARHIVANAHHLAPEVECVAPTLAPAGATLDVVTEPKILGTGGGLRNAWKHLRGDGPVVVMNGDILFAPNLEAAVSRHEASGAIATMVLRRDPAAHSFGAVETDDGGRVRRLLGEPAAFASASLEAFMFTGVHILSERAFADLPEDGCIIRQSYRRWVDRGEVVCGVVDDSPWSDLGTVEAYWRANVELASGMRAHDAVTATAPRGVVHPRASVAGDASVTASVVGQATIASGVAVERCVVWDGTTVRESVRDAVCWPGGVIQLEVR